MGGRGGEGEGEEPREGGRRGRGGEGEEPEKVGGGGGEGEEPGEGWEEGRGGEGGRSRRRREEGEGLWFCAVT